MINELRPFVLPESKPYWDAAAKGKLSIQQCQDCNRFYFPPAPVCPGCTSRNTAWVNVSGRATLYSYSITHRPWPAWDIEGPMSVALVELEEGPRLVSTVVNCEQTPDALIIDMPLRSCFRPFDGDFHALCFEPAETKRGHG